MFFFVVVLCMSKKVVLINNVHHLHNFVSIVRPKK